MIYKLAYIDSLKTPATITITGSKSESNRLLLLQAFFPQITIYNLSHSDDTQVMQQALLTHSSHIDVGHAGTAMRFLTAFFAVKNDSLITLTGSSRMQERPIKILVDALQSLGAVISYQDQEGFPPLQIKGTSLSGSDVVIPAGVSSQYISALMGIGPSLPKGITIHLQGEITSRPYIEMTLSLLQKIGVSATFQHQKIEIKPQQHIKPISITVESDWSSASYFYSMVALSKNATLTLHSFFEESLQGDKAVASIYERLGVQSFFNKDGSITLSKTKIDVVALKNNPLSLDLNSTPDIAQTIAVTCFGLGIGCDLYGLHTLKIKETDRLVALQTELQKLGATISVTNDSLHLQAAKTINKNRVIKTYKDHRMAMAFAPLCLKTSIHIEDPKVVSKSFPDFWEVLVSLGISIQ